MVNYKRKKLIYIYVHATVNLFGVVATFVTLGSHLLAKLLKLQAGFEAVQPLSVGKNKEKEKQDASMDW